LDTGLKDQGVFVMPSIAVSLPETRVHLKSTPSLEVEPGAGVRCVIYEEKKVGEGERAK
jgi:hypothetical protein